MTAQRTSGPWYRYPIVWFIVAVPASAVVMGGVMLTLAIQTPESVVRDDYYQAGRAINVDLRESRRAESLGVQARFRPLPTGKEAGWTLHVTLPRGSREQAIEEPIQVMLAHPTLARKDIDVTLAPDGPGRWQGRLGALDDRRIVAISADQGQWQLRGEIDFGQARVPEEGLELNHRPLGGARDG